MYQSQGPSPHALTPEAYWRPEAHQKDCQILERAWHLVGSTHDLARPGDFLTCNLLGHPLMVRNFRGQLRALSNVCAHRHCLISSRSRGHSPTMRCQYHGWEYSSQGRPCKIPAPQNFVPFPDPPPQLPGYRLETVGQLVFVCLDREAPGLEQHLGPYYEICQQAFGPDWNLYLSWNPDYQANWKVPVENSLESYHVPCVHPHSFGEDPGSQRSQHQFFANGSSFSTRLPFAHSRLDLAFQRCEGTVVEWLQGARSDAYTQVHIFPNLLFSFTDAISLCQCLLPCGPTRSRAVVLQFSRRGQGAWKEILAGAWGRLKGRITHWILREDQSLFEAIQKGLEASSQPGVLGICEERIAAFQRHLLQD
ncbi:Rieske 2Fe-2S domain-containing protein [bacterium]|nr:Rieske 2Fe-2S domain-containing protein [bacterium]